MIKMNKKGFAVSGIIYTILLIFVLFLTMMLYNLQDRKTILDEIKTDAVKAVEEENTLESLQARIELLEDDVKLFIKTHPVGSIYVTVATDEATAEMMNTKYEGSTWEAYGEGRVLMGVGNNGTSSYNTVGSTGGSESNSTTLTEANLPSHSHSIVHTHTTPSSDLTNGLAAKDGDHYHAMYMFYNNSGFGTTIPANAMYYKITSGGFAGTSTAISNQNAIWIGNTSTNAAHTHSVTGTIPEMTTNSQNTSASGTVGEDKAFKTSTLQPYVTVYMYIRIA